MLCRNDLTKTTSPFVCNSEGSKWPIVFPSIKSEHSEITVTRHINFRSSVQPVGRGAALEWKHQVVLGIMQVTSD